MKMGREKVLTTDSGRKKRRSVKAEYVVENGAQFERASERASAAGEEKSEFHTCSFVRSAARSLARSLLSAFNSLAVRALNTSRFSHSKCRFSALFAASSSLASQYLGAAPQKSTDGCHPFYNLSNPGDQYLSDLNPNRHL